MGLWGSKVSKIASLAKKQPVWVLIGLSFQGLGCGDLGGISERDWRSNEKAQYALETQQDELFFPVVNGLLEHGLMTALNWDRIVDAGVPSRIQMGLNFLGPDPYQRNRTVRFIPASNAKLFTQALALKKLGLDFRYQTRVWVGERLDARGSVDWVSLLGEGDPSWGMSEFDASLELRTDRIAEELKRRGVTRIEKGIRLLAQDERWWNQRVPEGWVDEDPVSWYGSLAQPFSVALGGARFDVQSTYAGSWFEFGVEVPVSVKLQSGSRTDIRVLKKDVPGKVGVEFVLTGTLKKGDLPQLYLPVHDSSGWLRRLFVRSLEKYGIEVSKAAREFEVQGVLADLSLEEQSGEHFDELSPPLREILIPFMKQSLNQIGASLFHLMGAKFGDPKERDLLIAAEGVMKDFVDRIGESAARRANLPVVFGYFRDDVRLVDGSGISRSNEVTTDVVMALLLDLQAEGYFQEVWRELPIAGVDGTLKSRMKGSLAEGVLRAKTGTLSGVYNLSGFVPQVRTGVTRGRFLESPDDGAIVENYLPFVFLSRGEGGDSSVVRASQDRVGAKLTEILNSNW